MHNSFTTNDIAGSLVVAIAFSILLFAPGYVVAWLTDVFSFRRASLTERIPAATCLSVCISPLVVNLLARVCTIGTCSLFFILCAVAFAALVIFEWKRAPGVFRLPRRTVIGLCVAGIAGIVLIFSLVDIQVGSRLYPTVSVFDHSVRAAFISAALRSDAPPANPFFYPGSPIPSRYYYYWNVLCSVPTVLVGASPRVSLYGSVVWSALSLASIIPLYMKYFFREREALYRRSVIGIALLTVTGLDLVPTAIIFLRKRFLIFDMEWWDPNQVASWMDSLFWVPHHVASLVACLAGFLVLWDSLETTHSRRRLVSIGIAALAFASAAGLSIYVTLGFSIFLTVWTLSYLVRGRWRNLGSFVAAGILAIVVSLPYLHDLMQPSESYSPKVSQSQESKSASSRSARVLIFKPRVLVVFVPHGRIWTRPLQLFQFVVIYFLEFGFYAIAAIIVLRSLFHRRGQISEAQWAGLYMVFVVGFVATFVRSSVIPGNDFGWRSMLLVQFMLLLWGAQVFDELWFVGDSACVLTLGVSRVEKMATYLALVLGFMATAYQWALFRSALPVFDHGLMKISVIGEPTPPNIGRDNYRFREAFEFLDKRLHRDSIVQFNPFADDATSLLTYDRFQSAAASADCGVPFGGTALQCEAVVRKLTRIFPVAGAMSIRASELDELCDDLDIDVVIAHHSDEIWKQRDSWVWERTPLIANDAIRAFRCGSARLGPS